MDADNCGPIATVYAMYYALGMVPFSDESSDDPAWRLRTIGGGLKDAVTQRIRKWFKIMVATNGNVVAGDSFSLKMGQREKEGSKRYLPAKSIDDILNFM